MARVTLGVFERYTAQRRQTRMQREKSSNAGGAEKWEFICLYLCFCDIRALIC